MLNDKTVINLTLGHVTEKFISDNIFDGYARDWKLLIDKK